MNFVANIGSELHCDVGDNQIDYLTNIVTVTDESFTFYPVITTEIRHLPHFLKNKSSKDSFVPLCIQCTPGKDDTFLVVGPLTISIILPFFLSLNKLQ